MSAELMQVTSPHDPSATVPTRRLFEAWAEAGQRAFLAQHGLGDGPVEQADLLTRLALGERLAAEITAGRWVTVADLLRAGAGGAEIARALGMSVEQAREGFGRWVAEQAELYRASGLGLSPAEAEELRSLAEAVIA